MGTAEQMNKEPQLGAKRKIICEANNDRREWFMSKCQNDTPEQYFYTRARYAQDAKMLRKPQNDIFLIKHKGSRGSKSTKKTFFKP